MIEQVAATIRRYDLLAPAQPVAVAVSGGADSLCLLLLLQTLGYPVSVVHINHHLRGAESDADQEFVSSFAAARALPFRCFDAPVGPGNVEQNARDLRYAALRSLLMEGAYQKVALGHTLSDQAETVLFHFLRGSGSAGLAAMSHSNRAGFVRPLLDCSRAQVEQFLHERGIAWREDSSNRDLSFDRNRIRHELLPGLTRDWNPQLAQCLARTADIAREEEDYWRGEVERFEARFLTCAVHSVFCNASELRTAHPALARRVIRRAIELTKGDARQIGFEHVEAVRAIAASDQGHGRTILPGVDVLRSFDRMRFSQPKTTPVESRNASVLCEVPGTAVLPGARSSFVFELELSRGGYNDGVDALDWEQCAGPIQLRNWLPGDAYTRNGTDGADHGPSKLKQMFERQRIPLWDRSTWPVLTVGGRIVWSRQFGPAFGMAVTAATRTRLVIREKHQTLLVNESDSGVQASM